MTNNSEQNRISPIFMFGLERSGTTLLSMMIGAHPEVSVPLATTGMWFSFFNKLDANYNKLSTRSDYIKLLDDVLAHERIKLWQTSLDRKRIIAKLKYDGFSSIIEGVHQEYSRSIGKTCWANMDIANLDNMHIINKWFPNAKFIHIIRDGRDVALSHQTMPYGSGNILDCATAWVNRISTNLRMGDILGPSKYMAIKFEDLVLESRNTLEKICGFLSIPFSDEMLKYEKTVDKRVPKEKMWLWPVLNQPPQTTKVSRWKKEMKRNQRIVFEWTAKPLLDELGYETYENIPKNLSAYLLELWYFLDRDARLKRLLEKFGIKQKSQLERSAQQQGN